jgi:hypothetical protein
MNGTNLFNLALETYNRILPELREKIKPDNQSQALKRSGFNLPMVSDVLDHYRPLPFQTILIGDCKDGLPFLFDLNQPANGALLVTGDPACGKTRQLQVMVESALQLYTPRQLQVATIASWKEDWERILETPDRLRYCHSLTPWYDRDVSELILNLASLADDRRNGRRRGAQVLLVIDDLSKITEIDYEAQVNLHWLIESGPQSGIWPLVSLEANQSQEMKYWVDVFRTRLLGHIDSPTLANDLSIYEGNRCAQLSPSAEFTVWMGNDWIIYNLPVLD